jgi:hypothetical protein
MKVFINPSQKTDKDFEYWIEQLSYHVAQKERFATFENQIRECLKKDSSHNAFQVFSTHKNLFHSALQIELFKMGLPKVKAAFNERLAQHKRLAAVKKTVAPDFLIHFGQMIKNSIPLIEPEVMQNEKFEKYRMIHSLLRRIHGLDLTVQHAAREEEPLEYSSEKL